MQPGDRALNVLERAFNIHFYETVVFVNLCSPDVRDDVVVLTEAVDNGLVDLTRCARAYLNRDDGHKSSESAWVARNRTRCDLRRVVRALRTQYSTPNACYLASATRDGRHDGDGIAL